MKSIFRTFILIFLFVSRQIYASDYVETGLLWLTQKSNTEPLWFHSNDSLYSLSNTPPRQSELQPYLMFEKHFKGFNGDFGAIFDENQKLSLDYYQNNLGIEFFYRPSYEFKNPYQLFVSREFTYVYETGIAPHYKYSIDATSNLDISYSLSYKKLQDDELEKISQGFKRSGNIHKLQCSYLNDYFNLIGSIYTSQNMGAFYSFKGYDMKLQSMYPYQNMQFYGSLYIKHDSFDNINPYFGNKESATSAKISFSGEYDFPSQYYISTWVSHQKQISNIEFYNESTTIFSIGFGKNF